MIHDIHRRVLKRLAYGWMSLSILIGGIVFYIEMEKVDNLVLKLATKESAAFTAENLRYFNRPDADTGLLREKVQEFLRSHFIIIELYGRDKKIILEAMDPGKQIIEKELTQYAHRFPLSDTTYYRKFYIDQQIFLQVLLPLKESDGKLGGYFEGVYQVDEETLHDIKSEIFGSLLLVIVVTLATTLVLYPIIISLNKGLIKLSSDLLEGNIQLMEVLGSAIAKRDSDTNAHNYRVTLYAIRLAETLRLESAQIRSLIAGAFLHDVGKIGISDTILLKHGPLSDEEFTLMRNHVLLGMDIHQKIQLAAPGRGRGGVPSREIRRQRLPTRTEG
ncbi:MAG: HD domain-containing protein [Gammaproteobacteria bacterium]